MGLLARTGMSIRARCTLVLFAALFLMAGGISLAARVYAAKEADAAFARMCAAQLDRVEEVIHAHFRAGERIAENLATLPETRAAALARSRPVPPSTIPATEDGDTHTPEHAVREILDGIRAYVPGVDAVFCGYADGSFSSSPAVPDREGYDPAALSWFSDAPWTRFGTAVTGMFLSKTAKSLAATVAARITDDAGNTLGVVALDLSLAPLVDALRDIRPGRTGSLVLFDATGRVLLDPKAQEYLLLPAGETGDASLAALAELPAGSHAVIREGTAMAAFSRVLHFSGWKAVLLMDTAEQGALVRDTAVRVMWTAAALCLLLTGLGFLYAKTAARPLYALIRQSDALADGNADALAGIPGSGPEVTRLHGNFGRLTGRILLLMQAEKDAADKRSGMREIGLPDERAAALYDTDQAVDAYRPDERLVFSRQAEELEKNATDAAATARNCAACAHETARALAASMRNLAALPDGIAALKNGIAELGVVAGAVRDLAGQANLLGLNLSIEAAGRGENGREAAPAAEKIRLLAEGAMAATGALDTAIAALDHCQAAHAVCVGASTSSAKRAAKSTEKMEQAAAAAVALTRTAAEQTRVLATALEGFSLTEK